MRFFDENIDIDVFDDVHQNTKHRAYDASNDVNRPPLCVPALPQNIVRGTMDSLTKIIFLTEIDFNVASLASPYCLWLSNWHHQLALSYCLHQPELSQVVHSINHSNNQSINKSINMYFLSQFETPIPIDRNRDTWVRWKVNLSIKNRLRFIFLSCPAGKLIQE